MILKTILLGVTLLSTLQASPPSWYVKNSINAKNYEYIGYGEAKSKERAKKLARVDIANSLHIDIKVSSELKTSQQNDNYNESMQQKIEEKTDISLDGVEVVKSSYADGIYYVALKYINLPFAKKVKMQFRDVTKIAKESNHYLKKTLLLQELKKEFGFYPKVNISRGNLLIADKSFKISKDTVKKLFSSQSSRFIKLKIPLRLENSEYYFVEVESKKRGYLTLLQIYEDGGTSLLFSNKKIKKGEKFEYPNREEYDGLQAYLTKTQIKAKDMTMAIVCKEKKEFDYFDNISIYNEKYAKLYGKIFDMIDGCEVSSQIVDIRR